MHWLNNVLVDGIHTWDANWTKEGFFDPACCAFLLTSYRSHRDSAMSDSLIA